MAKSLPDTAPRISARPGAPAGVDPEALRRTREALRAADSATVPGPAPATTATAEESVTSVAVTPAGVFEGKEMALLCRVRRELGRRVKRMRTDYDVSESAIIADALEAYFAERDDATIAAAMKAKGASLRRTKRSV